MELLGHPLLGTGLADTLLELTFSHQEHHKSIIRGKFHFSLSPMGGYYSGKSSDLNNESGFYCEENLYFGLFILQRNLDTKP